MVPHCKDCGSAQLLQGIAIVGAVIMPHNIYLHSALVQSRDINREKPKEIKLGNQNKIAHFKEPLRWLKFSSLKIVPPTSTPTNHLWKPPIMETH